MRVLDPLLDRSLFAQPAVVPDQVAVAHPVSDGGELRLREVVWMRPNFSARMGASSLEMNEAPEALERTAVGERPPSFQLMRE